MACDPIPSLASNLIPDPDHVFRFTGTTGPCAPDCLTSDVCGILSTMVDPPSAVPRFLVMTGDDVTVTLPTHVENYTGLWPGHPVTVDFSWQTGGGILEYFRHVLHGSEECCYWQGLNPQMPLRLSGGPIYTSGPPDCDIFGYAPPYTEPAWAGYHDPRTATGVYYENAIPCGTAAAHTELSTTPATVIEGWFPKIEARWHLWGFIGSGDPADCSGGLAGVVYGPLCGKSLLTYVIGPACACQQPYQGTKDGSQYIGFDRNTYVAYVSDDFDPETGKGTFTKLWERDLSQQGKLYDLTNDLYYDDDDFHSLSFCPYWGNPAWYATTDPLTVESVTWNGTITTKAWSGDPVSTGHFLSPPDGGCGHVHNTCWCDGDLGGVPPQPITITVGDQTVTFYFSVSLRAWMGLYVNDTGDTIQITFSCNATGKENCAPRDGESHTTTWIDVWTSDGHHCQIGPLIDAFVVDCDAQTLTMDAVTVTCDGAGGGSGTITIGPILLPIPIGPPPGDFTDRCVTVTFDVDGAAPIAVTARCLLSGGTTYTGSVTLPVVALWGSTHYVKFDFTYDTSVASCGVFMTDLTAGPTLELIDTTATPSGACGQTFPGTTYSTGFFGGGSADVHVTDLRVDCC